MSSKIDQRIVEMSFENHKFEDGINKSKNSLKEFSNALQNMGTGKDFGGLENSIQSISSSFSVLEQIGIGALRRIGEAALTAGTNMIKHLTIDPLTQGWTKYEQKTASVQTIMNATGKSIDEVNGYLDKLMWFSDETSYGFTDMTSALAQMTSSGGDIETLIPLITGVANATAYAGKGANEFTRAMFNLNQSYGMGNLQGRDWMSLELAGVAGKELKQVFIDTGKALGTLDANGKTAKGTLVDIGNFGSTLQEKWANTKVMETAFGEFSKMSEEVYELVNNGTYETAAEAMEFLAGKYSQFAERGFKSAQQAKSFTEAIAATLDAVSSGWLRTYELVFGTLHEATANFSALSAMLWEVFASSAEGRNAMLRLIKDAGGIKSIFQTFKNVAVALLKPLKAISQAFDQFFPPKTEKQWMGIIGVLETVSKRLIITDETAHKIQRTFAGFFAVLDIGWETVKFLGSALYEIVDVFIPLGGSLLNMTASAGDFLVALNHLIKETGIFQYGLLGIKIVAIIVRDAFSSIIRKVSEFGTALWTADKPLELIGKTMKKIFSGVIDTLQTGVTWISTKLIGALSGVQKFFATKLNIDSEGIIGGILEVLKEFISFLMDGGTDALASLGDALGNLDFSRIATFVTGGILLLFINQLSNLTKSMADVVATTNSFMTKFSKKLFGTTTKIKDLAYVFGILSASLYVLSRIPWEDMKVGLAGLAGAMLLFVAAYGALQAITVASSKALNGIDVIKSTFTLTALAAGMVGIAIALQQISKVPEEDVWRSVGVLAALMVMVTGYQALSALISTIPGQNTLVSDFKGLTFGLVALIGAILLLQLITPETINSGLTKLKSIMGVLIGVQVAFSFAALIGGGNKLATSMWGISVGILGLLAVLKILSAVNISEMSVALGTLFKLSAILAGIQVMFGVAARVSGGVRFKANIFAMQMGLISMVALLAIMEKIGQDKLQNGISTLIKMAGIIAGLEILTAVAARIGGGNKLQKILGSVTWTMLAFTGLIGVISFMTPETIDKGLTTIKKMLGIIVAFQTIVGVTARLGLGATAGLSTIVGMVTGILTVAASLALLSMLDQTALAQSAKSMAMTIAAVGIMSTGIGIMMKTLSGIPMGFGGLKAIIPGLLSGFAAVGVVILATLALFEVIQISNVKNVDWSGFGKFTAGMAALTVLVTAFTMLTKVPGLVGGGAGIVALIPGFAGMVGVVVATAGLFEVISWVLDDIKNIKLSDFGMFIAGIALISVMAIGISLLSVPLGILGAAALPALTGIAVAIVGVGAIILAFALLADLMNFFYGSNPDILIKGFDLLVLVGEGIGRFIGAIAGGINSQLMISYGEGLAGFAAAIEKINPASFDGVESLAKALLILTGTSILDGLSRFVNSGKNPGEVFGEQISGLINAFKGITVEDAMATSAILAAITPMMDSLKSVINTVGSIPNSGGLAGLFAGENDADEFGKQIAKFIKSFSKIDLFQANHTSNIMYALSPMIINFKALTEATGVIPNSGGVLGYWVGNNNIDKFGKQIGKFIKSFGSIELPQVNHTANVMFALAPMITNFTALTGAAGSIPNEGGIISWFGGNNNIDTFGKQIAKFVKSLSDLDISKVTDASNNLKIMASDMLPGLKRFVTLSDTLQESAGGWTQALPMLNFAVTLKEFVKILSDIDASVVAPALKSLAAINESFKVVGSEVIESAIKSFENNKQPFQSVIAKMLDETIKMVESKKTPLANSFTSIISNALKQSRTYIADFNTLGYDLVRGLKTGVESGQGLGTKAITDMTKNVTRAAYKGLEVESPSKVFAEIGKWLPAGLGEGIKRNSKVAILASANMGYAVEEAIRDATQVHSKSPLYVGIGKWMPKSWAAGIEEGKGKLLQTAEDLGLDTTKISVKGMVDGLTEGEGIGTKITTSLMELLTGKPADIVEGASASGAAGGGAFADGVANAIGSSSSKKKVAKSAAELAEDAFQAFQKQMNYLTEYDLITPEVEISKWEEFSKQYVEGTETRLKADKHLAELRYNYSKTWIDREKYYKRLSLEEELAAWTRVQQKYKEGHAYRLEAERELFRLKQEIQQLEYQNAMDQLDDDKYYGRLNLTQELKRYKQIQKITEETSDERKKTDREIFRLENEIRDANLAYEEKLKNIESERNDKRIQAEQEYYDKTKEINDRLKNDIQSLNDEYENAVKSRAQSLYSAWGLFDKVDPFEAVNGEDLIGNLEDQVVAFDQWQAQIAALSAKGVDEGLIDELRAMGPKALPQILALNKLTDSQLNMYVSLWKKKSKEAKDQAVYELQDMKEETNLKIQELTEEAEEELRYYKKVWKDSLRDINKDAKRQLDELEKDWVDNIGGMTDTGISLIQQFRLEWFGELSAMISDTKAQMAELQRLTKNAKAFETVGNSVRDAVSKVKLDDLGKGMVTGLSNGAMGNVGLMVGAGTFMAKTLLGTVAKTIGYNSPAKEFIKMGKGSNEGLAEGLRRFSGLVYAEGKSMGQTALEAVSLSMNAIPDLLGSDVDAFTITPVLDLTNVRSGMYDMNSMFNSAPGLDLGATMDILPAAGGVNQNGILTAIKDSLLAVTNPEVDLSGVLTVQVVNDKGEIVSIAETAIKDILRRESR